MTSRFEMTKAAHMKFPTSLLGDGDIQLWIDVVNGTTHEDYDEAHEETRVCLFGDHAAYWMAWRWHADNAGYVQENSIPLVRAQGLIKTLTSLGC